MLNRWKFLMTLTCFMVSACGGGGGSSSTPDAPTLSAPATTPAVTVGQGRLLADFAIQGMSYASGESSGLTDENGTFTYEIVDGEPREVLFSVGAVEFGSAGGASWLTLIDLIEGGSTESTEVLNLVRLAWLLDSDGFSGSGITIAEDTRVLAEEWPQVDFTLDANAFRTSDAITRIVSDLASINEGADELAEQNTANSGITISIACRYSGVYTGRLAGDANDRITIVIMPGRSRSETPLPYAFGYADALGHFGLPYFTGADDTTVSFPFGATRDFEFRKPADGSTITATGRFPSVNTISGEWSNSVAGTSGTFSGERLVSSTAQTDSYIRDVGGFQFSDGTFGIAVDIDVDGRVTGMGFDGHRLQEFRVDGQAEPTPLIVNIARTRNERSLLFFSFDYDNLNYEPTPTDVGFLANTYPYNERSTCFPNGIRFIE